MHTNKTLTKVKAASPISYLVNPNERLLIWEKARGMWKNRKPDPIKELNKMRKESSRKLPKLHAK